MGVLLEPAPDQAEVGGRKLPYDLSPLSAPIAGAVRTGSGRGGIPSGEGSGRGGMASSGRHGTGKHKPKLTLPRPVPYDARPHAAGPAGSSTGTRGKRPSGRA